VTWTKRQIIEQAFDELALASYTFDITPDELQAAGRRLDAQMATWANLGLVLPYKFAASAVIDVEAESGLPMVAIEATYLALAVKTAASKGKALSTSTTRAAKAAYDALLLVTVKDQTREVQLASGTPCGSGHKGHTALGGAFFADPNTDTLKLGDSGGLTFSGA